MTLKIQDRVAYYANNPKSKFFALSLKQEDREKKEALLTHFKSISSCPDSTHILRGLFTMGGEEMKVDLPEGDEVDFLIYEKGIPLRYFVPMYNECHCSHPKYNHCHRCFEEDIIAYFDRLRDILVGLHNLHNRHEMCHGNIVNDEDSLVVCGELGKLSSIVGCSTEGECTDPEHKLKDLKAIKNVVEKHLGNDLPNRFKFFLDLISREESKYFKCETPSRIIRDHPIWGSAGDRLQARLRVYNCVERLRFRKDSNAKIDGYVCFTEKCRVYQVNLPKVNWQELVKGCGNEDLIKALNIHNKLKKEAADKKREGEEAADRKDHERQQQPARVILKRRREEGIQKKPASPIANETAIRDKQHSSGVHSEQIESHIVNDQREQILEYFRFGRNVESHRFKFGKHRERIEDSLEGIWPNFMTIVYDIVIRSLHDPSHLI